MWTVGNILTSNAAVDFSKPYNIVPSSIRTIPLSSQFTTENDWRQYSRIIYADSDAIGLSYQISASAVDNYGENFQIWLSVYVYGGERDGRILYNSGWKEGVINEDSFNNQSRDDIRVIMRVKYKDDSGHYNPPTNNSWSGASFTITYDKYQNYDVIPQEWQGTTTISTPDYPDPVFTTTAYMTNEERSDLFETVKYTFATIFGIADSWESAVQVMNYMNNKLPYVIAISLFCGTVGICVWFMEL